MTEPVAEAVRNWVNEALAAWKRASSPPMWELRRELKVDEALVRPLVASIPETWIGDVLGTKKQKLFEFWNLTDGRRLVDLQGVLTCHALSPMGDTIELLADLGRTARIAAVLGKRVTVLLADHEWSKYNRMVDAYGLQNIDDNEQFRQKLYGRLGFTLRECNPNNATGIEGDDILESARQYAELAEALLGESLLNRTLTAEELATITRTLPLPKSKRDHGELLTSRLVIDRLRGDLDVLAKVAKYLGQLDRPTFIYYLTQRYHQWAFPNFLKVAVRSEKNFDGPFHELDLASGHKIGITRAIYFREYVLRVENGRPPIFVIPYYFPSGSLFTGTDTRMADYRRSAILLDAASEGDGVANVFERMPWPHNARLLADFLSFVHFLTMPWEEKRHDERKSEVGRQESTGDDAEVSVGGRPVPRKFRSIVDKKIQEVAPELFAAWKHYARSPGVFCANVRQWCDWAVSLWSEDAVPPYYLFPYYWLRPAEGDRMRAVASKLLTELLVLVADHIEVPQVTWREVA